MLKRQIENDGLGVFVEGEGQALQFTHSGANEGFQCILVAFARTGQGAAIMTNSDSASRLASEILRAISQEYGWPDHKLAERTIVNVDPALFRDYVGRFQLAPDFILTITQEGDHLFAQATGQPKAEIFAESDHEFFPKVSDAQITFVRDSQGHVTELILHQGGEDTHAKRIE